MIKGDADQDTPQGEISGSGGYGGGQPHAGHHDYARLRPRHVGRQAGSGRGARLVESMQKQDPEEFARPDLCNRHRGSPGVGRRGSREEGVGRVVKCVCKGRSLETRRRAVVRTVHAVVAHSGSHRGKYVGRRNG